MRSTLTASFPSYRWPWILLPGRWILFFLFQALFAVVLNLSGYPGWAPSAAWWPAVVTLTNLACLVLLVRLFHQEGCSYWDLFRLHRKHLKGDLLALLGTLLVAGPVSMLPNTMLATALFGDSLTPVRMFLTPLPPVGVFTAIVLFPVTQGLVELAYYFLYILPRLEKQIQPWLAYGLASFFLGIQHMTVPLLFDGRFILWRATMFIPFALLVGGILKWRPRMLPYLAIVHILIDMATGVMYLTPF